MMKSKTRKVYQLNEECEKCIFFSLEEKQVIANRILHLPNNFYCTLRKALISSNKTNPYTCILHREES